MKHRIRTVYPHAQFGQSSNPALYIADFTERTRGLRKVELHEAVPQTPEGDKAMDCLIIDNPHFIAVDCNIFGDNQFKDDRGKDIQHCECCLFPSMNHDTSWVAFIEIKDCEPKNIANYKDKAKEQIISTVQLFKSAGIVEKQNIYGIVSFPRRKKTAFNAAIFTDYAEYKGLYKKHHIRFYPSNAVQIKDDKTLGLI